MAQIDAWVAQSEQRIEAVFKDAAQEVIAQMQARVPVDTGFARASLRVSKTEMPQIIPGLKGQEGRTYSYDAGEVALTINGLGADETIYAGFTASYAPYLEVGHSKQAPAGFVRLTAQLWPQIVAESVAKAKASVLK